MPGWSSNREFTNKWEISAGVHPYAEQFHKFGRNATVAAGDGIWPTSTAFPLGSAITAGVATITSSSDDDNKSAATGALTVQVQGLDSNKNEIEETITLSGTDNVTTTNTYSRIYRMYVVTAGSGNKNAGNITATIGGTEVARIGTGQNQTEQAWFTIPTGFTGLVTKMRVALAATGGTARTADIELRRSVSEDSNVMLPMTEINLVSAGTSAIEMTFEPPLKVAEKLDVLLACKAISAENEIDGSFDLVLLKEM